MSSVRSLAVLAVMVAASGVVGLGCDHAKPLYEAAQQAEARNEYGVALELYRKARAQDPNSKFGKLANERIAIVEKLNVEAEKAKDADADRKWQEEQQARQQAQRQAQEADDARVRRETQSKLDACMRPCNAQRDRCYFMHQGDMQYAGCDHDYATCRQTCELIRISK